MKALTLPLASLCLLAACQPADAPDDADAAAVAAEDGALDADTGEAQAAETVADAPVELVELWKLEGFSAPEGVAQAPDGGYFISNVAGNGSTKDGSGWVSKISAFGEMIEPVFANQMDAPKGMVVDRGILYVADLDRIHLVDEAEGTLLRTIEVDGAEALNDMVAWNASVLVSDSATKRIYRLSGDDVDIWLEDDRLSGVNGLTAHGDRLLVATMESGSLYEVNEARELTEIASGMENADGIGFAPGGYLVSSWPGHIWFVSEDGEVSEILNTQQRGILQNDLTTFGDTAIVPNWMPGTVTAWKVQAAE